MANFEAKKQERRILDQPSDHGVLLLELDQRLLIEWPHGVSSSNAMVLVATKLRVVL